MLFLVPETISKYLKPKINVSLFARTMYVFIFCCALICGFTSDSSAEQMVTALSVNGEKKGDVFVWRTENGDFLLRVEDLKEAGLSEATGTVTQEGGEPHISLRSIAGISLTFDENNLILNLTAAPSLFSRSFIDFAGRPIKNVYYPKESSLFLNYGFQYQAGDDLDFQGVSLTNEIGIRRGEFLFLADTLFTKDSRQADFVRLNTSVIRDDREILRRTTFGDLFASTGALGSSVSMGGVGVTKVFGMDPYLITYPTLDVVGQASLPSEVDIYVNGAKIRTERISPGEFQLKNLSSYGGAGVVELVVRDSFGREQRYLYPIYAADNILLKKGLHDYSYNIGFLRENFGLESNRYSKPIVVAFHRYGLNDFFSLGFRAEADKKVINGGPQTSLCLWSLGVLNLTLSGSSGHETGLATDLSYQYQNGGFNAKLFYQHFSKGYERIVTNSTEVQQNYVAGAGFGYTYPKLGSLSFDLSTQKTHDGLEKKFMTISYSKNIFENISLNATFNMTRDSFLGHTNNFTINLTYIPKTDTSVSARHSSTEGRETETIQVQKNAPRGEGIGYRAFAGREHHSGQDDVYTINPMLQLNGRYAITRGEISAAQNRGRWDTRYQFNASGALVMLDGVASLTRPVTDSFVTVKVGDIKGVTVRSGGRDIGRTDSSGRIFLTNLSSYSDNLITINDKDIPIEYYFPIGQKYISPPLRSGSCVGFVVKKMQPVTGTLAVKVNDEFKPVEFYEAELQVDGSVLAFPTGRGGEFYLDLSQSEEFKKRFSTEEKNCSSIADDTSAFLKPGTYQASIPYEGRRHFFNLTIPDSSDPIIDLGQVVITRVP
jgi:outer membrane usher protein